MPSDTPTPLAALRESIEQHIERTPHPRLVLGFSKAEARAIASALRFQMERERIGFAVWENGSPTLCDDDDESGTFVHVRREDAEAVIATMRPEYAKECEVVEVFRAAIDAARLAAGGRGA